MSGVFVRARDVRSAVKEQGFEDGLVHLLERICEENAGHRQALQQMAELLAKCIDQFDKMVTVSDAMKASLQELERRDQQYKDIQGDQLPPSS